MDRYAFLSPSLTHELHRIVPLQRCIAAIYLQGNEEDEDVTRIGKRILSFGRFRNFQSLSLSLSGFRGSRGMDLIRFETKE